MCMFAKERKKKESERENFDSLPFEANILSVIFENRKEYKMKETKKKKSRC